MNTGTRRASARRKSTVMASRSGSRRHNGSERFHQRRAERAAQHRLDFAGRRRADRRFGLRALRIDHRLADDADAHAGQRAGSAARARMHRITRQHRGARHGGERIARIVIARVRIFERVEHYWRNRRSCGNGCRCGRNKCRRRWRRRRSRASPCAAVGAPPHCDWTDRGTRRGFPRRGSPSPGSCSPTVPSPSSNRARLNAWCRKDWRDCRPRCCADSRASRAELARAGARRRDRRRGRYIRY